MSALRLLTETIVRWRAKNTLLWYLCWASALSTVLSFGGAVASLLSDPWYSAMAISLSVFGLLASVYVFAKIGQHLRWWT